MSKEEALRRIKEFAKTGATQLDIGLQDLTELPPELFELKQLTVLYLYYNHLSSLSPKIFQLKNLIGLDLSGNSLASLPPEIVQLKNLTTLGLNGNQLTSLPPEIAQLPKLEWLKLDDNPLTSPPYELAVQGIHAIREYFTSLEEGGQTLAEVKIILIGEGASGKTSLTRCLRGERFDPHEATTHGIRIKDWQLDTGSQHVRCKLWDFGGQEIMHATHQFFLSRRSLYVLVLDGRRDERPEYWLRYIESFGGGSPVLVVLNKYDTNPGFDLNRPFLQEKYPFIKGFWKTSCKTGNLIAEFKQALCEELNNVPLTKNEWPTSWFRAKARLEQMNEPRISYEKFETVCREAGVSGKISRNVLAAFLHDLGIVIHFDEFELDSNNILDPKWVTGAVYKIINAELIAAGKGLLRLDALKEILAWQEGDEYRYERNDYIFIINLMKKFELCYELNAKEVLLPQLLDVSEPSFDFKHENALRFVLHYEDFLPPSVMPRFIVKRHHEIKDKLRWRSGVVLQNPMLEATAVVKVDVEARRVHIAVTGKERKVFLALIWLSLREINSGFAGLKVNELIPMPDDADITEDYETLLNYAEQGLEKIIPKGTKKAYSVRELLAGVHFDSQSEGERMIAIAEGEREAGGLRGLINKMNRYVEGELNLFGLKIKYQNIAEDVLNRERRKE
ncbi:MAG: COR domain-containing protein [Candidatus Electronema sp. V4]|uniref:COR domain-containing protein n=1 Tax=Candidatus Electronema sp. V4 TaxID=3454756 RepID=UPI0040558858